MHTTALARAEIIDFLAARDGYQCTYPGCGESFDDDPDSPNSVTIDHIYPQSRARSEGWAEDEIQDTSNLQLQSKRCNAKKSDRIYNEDGTLPSRGRVRVIKRDRPGQCETCMSGRLLLHGEVCVDCGSGPQPATAPKYLQRTPKECDHDTSYCWFCYLGMIERRSALSVLLLGHE